MQIENEEVGVWVMPNSFRHLGAENRKISSHILKQVQDGPLV